MIKRIPRMAWLLALVLAVGLLVRTPSLFAAIGDRWAITNESGTDLVRVDSNGDLLPGTDGTHDLGSSTLEWQDIHIDGTANIDSLSADSTSLGSLSVTKTLTDGAAGQGGAINVTAQDTGSGTTEQYGLSINNVASTEGLDAALEIVNSDADDAVAYAIYANDEAGGGITNFLYDGTTTISMAEVNALDGGIDRTEMVADTIDFTEIADALTIDAATTVTGGAGNSFSLARTLTDASDETGMAVTVTASDTTSGATAQYGLVVDNAASTEGLDAALVIDNSDADDAVAAAIRFIDAGGGFTALFDVAGTLLSAAEVNLLDGGTTNAELTDTGTLTATTVDINGGAIDGTAIGAAAASTGAFTTLASTGVTTIGDNSSTVAIDSSDWDIDATGAITGAAFDANGAGNSLSNVENADLADDTLDFDKMLDALALDAATSITGAAGEVLSLVRTLTDASAENAMTMTVTASDAGAGTTDQYGLYIDNAASTEGLDAALVIDNSDADDAVGAAIKFVDAGGTFTALLDVAGTLLSAAEVNLLDGGITLAELTDSGTLTAGTVDINGGNVDGVDIGNTVTGAGAFSDLSNDGELFVSVEVTEAGTITVDTTDFMILCDTTSAPVTVNLPAVAGLDGMVLWVKDEAGNAGAQNITVTASGAENIDGSNTYVMNVNYEAVQIVCDGTEWWVVGSHLE